jgi:hypothetical protein
MHPVRLSIQDDLARSRLTVFFRFFLAIPHFFWLVVWGGLVGMIAFVNWFVVLFTRQTPDGFHELITRYIRYATHVNAYVFLAAEQYPGFAGVEGSYPVDVHFDPPAPQNRWKTGFRLILAIPAFLIASALYGSGGGRGNGYNISLGLLAVAGFCGWFACLARARMPRGLRDAAAYALAYSAQIDAYFLLVTDRYPDSDPVAAIAPVEVDPHPVELTVDDDLRRSRLTTFFRLLLAFPHIVWLLLWGLATYVVAFLNWFATLFTGRSPDAFHRFIGAYVRYSVHVTSFAYLVGNPFPGFLGKPGTYPIDVTIAPRERQNRWKTGFRLVLVLPALLIGSAYGGLLGALTILMWFVALFTAKVPRGLRNAAVAAQSYTAQTAAYYLLLTDRYPYSGPVIRSMADGYGGDPEASGPAALGAAQQPTAPATPAPGPEAPVQPPAPQPPPPPPPAPA